MDSYDLSTPLQPLLSALEQGRFLRLVAQPDCLVGDRLEGDTVRADVPWTASAHAQGLAALAAPLLLPNGAVVFTVGAAIVLLSPPACLWKTEDLARIGWLSPLCAHLLSASLAMGRNILVVGPWSQSVQLMAALVSEGTRPALLGTGREAAPSRWIKLTHWGEAQAMGADRIAAWSLCTDALVDAMGRLTGVVGWLDARRLDRALIRFETGAEGLTAHAGDTPLHVLGALDLVVVMHHQGLPQVREVAEVVLADEGYRPRLLFASGLDPAPTALMPVGVPNFLGELAQSGYQGLAQELLSAVPASPSDDSEMILEPPPQAAEMLAPQADAAPPPRRTPRSAHQPAAVGEDTALAYMPPGSSEEASPGWELDRLFAGAPSAAQGPDKMAQREDGTSEDCAMAATHGLAPPPRPHGGSSTMLAEPVATAVTSASSAQDDESRKESVKPA